MNRPTPRELGFSMPPEWAIHDAIWLVWPHNVGTWPGKVPLAEQAVARWVREIVRDRPGQPPERVELIVRDAAEQGRAEAILGDWDIPSDRVRFHQIPNNDCWIRDFGPTFVTREADPGDGLGRLACVAWRFDTWGGKGELYYGETADLEGRIAPRIAEILGVPVFQPTVIVEGGGIEVNGAGTLITTTNCFVEGREQAEDDPALLREALEAVWRDYLGVSHVVWLDGVAFEGDDTEGHIDNLARFVGPRTNLTVIKEDRADPLYEPLRRNLRALEQARDQDGRGFEVATVALPADFRFRCERYGQPERWQYPVSYANFLVTNGAVLVPTYADAKDLPALETIQRLFPERAVIGIDCCDFILGQGAIHCASQQQPRP